MGRLVCECYNFRMALLIDGYNLLDYLSGKVKESPRSEFIYVNDGGEVVGEDDHPVDLERHARQSRSLAAGCQRAEKNPARGGIAGGRVVERQGKRGTLLLLVEILLDVAPSPRPRRTRGNGWTSRGPRPTGRPT